MSSELKLCKTCGLPAEVKPPGIQRGVRCSDSSGECPDSRHFVQVDEWNRRTPSPAVRALVEACKGLVPTLRSGDWGNQDETADEIDKALAAVEREIGNA